MGQRCKKMTYTESPFFDIVLNERSFLQYISLISLILHGNIYLQQYGECNFPINLTEARGGDGVCLIDSST